MLDLDYIFALWIRHCRHRVRHANTDGTQDGDYVLVPHRDLLQIRVLTQYKPGNMPKTEGPTGGLEPLSEMW